MIAAYVFDLTHYAYTGSSAPIDLAEDEPRADTRQSVWITPPVAKLQLVIDPSKPHLTISSTEEGRIVYEEIPLDYSHVRNHRVKALVHGKGMAMRYLHAEAPAADLTALSPPPSSGLASQTCPSSGISKWYVQFESVEAVAQCATALSKYLPCKRVTTPDAPLSAPTGDGMTSGPNSLAAALTPLSQSTVTDSQGSIAELSSGLPRLPCAMQEVDAILHCSDQQLVERMNAALQDPRFVYMVRRVQNLAAFKAIDPPHGE
ncbi:hypothetical protein H4R34_002890 [Dimargaris verticillata]|uniref:Uncharacterized protein n=1 Tax=Dimargaris verticillata TaxID=2761393 RepID=A0A9W8ED52_9FUNG|nr:hypothetical protein H4R34_002890 [Dimargaris verticillata]